MHILVFRSAEDRDYDKFMLAPNSLDNAQTADLVDAIVRRVKQENEDWQWDDIEAELEKAGFISVGWAHCDEEV